MAKVFFTWGGGHPHVKKLLPPHVKKIDGHRVQKKCPADFPITMVEFSARMADFSRSGVVTKMFALEFCAEWSNREVHSSHGYHFLDNFFVYVSEPCFGTQKLTPSRKMSSSKRCSHRNSVQNGPIERSTALTGTTFVTISVLCLGVHFQSQKPHVKKDRASHT